MRHPADSASTVKTWVDSVASNRMPDVLQQAALQACDSETRALIVIGSERFCVVFSWRDVSLHFCQQNILRREVAHEYLPAILAALLGVFDDK